MKKHIANANLVDDLNKSPVGCVPCKKEALKIERKLSRRRLTELKIEEIKKIVKSIFSSTKNDY